MTKRWTEVLCQKCGGNGVVKIHGGVSECPRCGGRCFDPVDNEQPQSVPTPIVALRALVAASGGSQKNAARAIGISPQNVCDVLHGRREISARLASALGYQRIVTFIKQPNDRSRDHEFTEGADGSCYACGRVSIHPIHVSPVSEKE